MLDSFPDLIFAVMDNGRLKTPELTHCLVFSES